MSPSGAELLRQVKSQIEEVDPAVVAEHLGNGMVLVDVRETDEFGAATSPARSTCRESYLESRIEGAAPDRDAAGHPLLRLRQPLGVGRPHADRGPRLRAASSR